MKKALCGILVLLILTGAVISCDSESADTDTPTATAETTGAETEDMSLIDELPDLNYGGAVYSMLSYPDNKDGHTELDCEEITGDTLNDACYEANRRVEARFNIKFDEQKITTWDKAASLLKKLVLAGDTTYSMAQMVDRDAMTLAMQGRYFYAMDELTNVNLNKAYYIQDANKTFSIAGTIYITYSSYMIGFYDCLHFMLYNKQIAADCGISGIYTLIRNGEWTVDKLFEIASTAASDLDGDGEWTDSDQYGIVYHSMDFWCGFWAAEGIKLIDKDSDDLPYFNVPGNEKLFALFDKLYGYAKVDTSYDFATKKMKKYSSSQLPQHIRAIEMFKNDQALFTSSWMYNVQAYLRDMDSDYGIIPFPTYDTKTAGTPYNGQSITAHIVVIPYTCPDMEMSSAVFEALNSEYARNVIPAYYDTVLCEKATRDTDSREMLDMMVANCVIDLGETAWLSIGRSVYYPLFTASSNKFASFTASHEKKVNAALETAIEAFATVKEGLNGE